MAKKTRFHVRGCGVFPFDCLRYDSASPLHESGPRRSTLMAGDWDAPIREVALVTEKAGGPSTRWESFGWRVVWECDVRSVAEPSYEEFA